MDKRLQRGPKLRTHRCDTVETTGVKILREGTVTSTPDRRLSTRTLSLWRHAVATGLRDPAASPARETGEVSVNDRTVEGTTVPVVGQDVWEIQGCPEEKVEETEKLLTPSRDCFLVRRRFPPAQEPRSLSHFFLRSRPVRTTPDRVEVREGEVRLKRRVGDRTS